MDNQLALFDPVITLVANNIKGREATKEESVIIDSAWVNAESSIRAMAWLSREGKTWKNLVNPNTGENYTSFEEYGKVRFGYEKTQLYDLASAYRVENILDNSAIAEKEIPITQTRQLNKLSDSEIPVAYERAIAAAKEEGVKLGARHVEQAVKAQKDLELKLNQQNELIESVKEQRDRILADKDNQLRIERETRQAVIDAKIAEGKYQAITENQNELQRVKSEAKALQNQLDLLKKQQDSQVTARVSGELAKLDLEIQAKENAVLHRQAEIDRLLETKKSLDKEVGDLQTHKNYSSQAKQSLAEAITAIRFAKESSSIPDDAFNDWKVVANMANEISCFMNEWLDSQCLSILGLRND